MGALAAEYRTIPGVHYNKLTTLLNSDLMKNSIVTTKYTRYLYLQLSTVHKYSHNLNMVPQSFELLDFTGGSYTIAFQG